MLATVGGAWVDMRGSLWRVSSEQMRKATNEEALGAELVNSFCDDLRRDLQHNRGPKKYVDVTRESGPPSQEDQEPLDSSDSDGDLADEEHEDDEPPVGTLGPRRSISYGDQPESLPASSLYPDERQPLTPGSGSLSQDQPMSEPMSRLESGGIQDMRADPAPAASEDNQLPGAGTSPSRTGT